MAKRRSLRINQINQDDDDDNEDVVGPVGRKKRKVIDSDSESDDGNISGRWPRRQRRQRRVELIVDSSSDRDSSDASEAKSVVYARIERPASDDDTDSDTSASESISKTRDSRIESSASDDDSESDTSASEPILKRKKKKKEKVQSTIELRNRENIFNNSIKGKTAKALESYMEIRKNKLNGPRSSESQGDEDGEGDEEFDEHDEGEEDDDSNDEYEKDFVDDSKLNDTSSYRSESTLGSGSSDTDDDEHDNNDESETCNEEETDETSDDEETEEQTKKSPIEDEDPRAMLENAKMILMRRTQNDLENEERYYQSLFASPEKKPTKRETKTRLMPLKVYGRLMKRLRKRTPNGKNMKAGEVLQQWRFLETSIDPECKGICVCGKTGIKYYNWIYNVTIEDDLKRTFNKIYVGSECIQWFWKSNHVIVDEDGEKIDNPILLFEIFLRKGLPATFKGCSKMRHPQKGLNTKALLFEIGGPCAKFIVDNHKLFPYKLPMIISSSKVLFKVFDEKPEKRRGISKQVKYRIFFTTKSSDKKTSRPKVTFFLAKLNEVTAVQVDESPEKKAKSFIRG